MNSTITNPNRTFTPSRWRRTFCSLFFVAAATAVASSTTPAVPARGTTLALTPAVGPPTSLVKAKGSGFAGREVVVLYFDGATVGSVVAGRTGKFNTHIQVPAAAGPGNHTVEALGR